MCIPQMALSQGLSSAWLKARSSFFTHHQCHVLLLALFSLLALFPKLHIGDLGGYDDAVYAHEGKQMLATGQWWSVYLNGQLDFDKPPLFVWFEALSMMVFGVNDFAARFPSALLGFGTLALVYLIARELSASPWVPVWAWLSLLTTQFFMRYAMHAMTDVPFTFFCALALYAYLKALQRPWWFIGCGLAISAAILMRSFLGFLPLGIVCTHLLVTQRWRVLWTKEFICGVTLALCLPLVWFISQYQLHGSRFLALHFSFTYENLPLTNGKNYERFGWGLLEYPRQLLKYYWPWLPLMLAGLFWQVRKLLTHCDATAWLLVLWVVCAIAPLSFAEFKWLRYLLPAFPAFALLTALMLDQWLTVERRKRFLPLTYVALSLLLLGMAANPKYHNRPEELRRLAPLAEAATASGQRIILFTERRPRRAHLYQLIWYANRFGELLLERDEALARLSKETQATVIMDKATFYEVLQPTTTDIQVLGETESFVCWTRHRPPESVAQNGEMGSALD